MKIESVPLIIKEIEMKIINLRKKELLPINLSFFSNDNEYNIDNDVIINKNIEIPAVLTVPESASTVDLEPVKLSRYIYIYTYICMYIYNIYI